MLPVGPGSSVIRTGLGPRFGRISDGFLVLDDCFVALSVPASVPTTDVAPFMLAPVDEIVVGSGFVVTSLLSSSSSELQ